jgi:hypothetical protein
MFSNVPGEGSCRLKGLEANVINLIVEGNCSCIFFNVIVIEIKHLHIFRNFHDIKIYINKK